jgi:hypothetical protein
MTLWVQGLLPGVPTDAAWPVNPGRRFVVVTTTVTARNPLGLIERWGVTLQSVAPDRDGAVEALAPVIDAANALRVAPVILQYVPAGGGTATSFALTRATVAGPDWQSAEPSLTGLMDRAVARLSVQVRIYP